jgi:predicted Zn-dependent protease
MHCFLSSFRVTGFMCLLACCLLCGAGAAQSVPEAPAAATMNVEAIHRSINAGHAAEALKQIIAMRAEHPETKGLSHLEGLAEYQLNDLHAADKAFAAAIAEDPHDAEAMQMRGLTLFRLGRPADAIPLLESAGKQGALGKADPNYILALCYIDTRRYDDARRAFAAQYGFPPDGAAAYLVTARMLLRREYMPVSQSFAQKALEINPNLPLAHELLGEIALAGNHLDEAIAELEKEKIGNPLEPSVYETLGDAYNRSAKYDDAQRNLQAAILLEPNATGPYISLGKTMLKKGDAVAAVTYLQRAEQLDPQNFRTHSLLGQAYRAMGRAEDASRETAMAEKIQAASEPTVDTAH